MVADPKYDVNWVNRRGLTSLMSASRWGYYIVVKALLQRQDVLLNHQYNGFYVYFVLFKNQSVL